MAPEGSGSLRIGADDFKESLCQLGDGAATRRMPGHTASTDVFEIWAAGVDAAGRGVSGTYFHLASEVGRFAWWCRAARRYAKGPEATSRESRSNTHFRTSRAGH